MPEGPAIVLVPNTLHLKPPFVDQMDSRNIEFAVEQGHGLAQQPVMIAGVWGPQGVCYH